MKARWRGREMSAALAFVLALLVGGPVAPTTRDSNEPGDVDRMNDEELRLVVEEGRRQLDSQGGRLEHVQGRSQALLTVSLAALAFTVSGFARLDRMDGALLVASVVVWTVALIAVLIALALSASVITVRADFEQVDTTQLSAWPSPVLPRLASEYANAVRIGEMTLALRITVFRSATRWVCWAAALTALVFLASV